jgi:hypothetical protein
VFELQALQQLLSTLSFKDYRMLTDFVNFKFTNTTGVMRNMQLNETDFDPVLDILCTPPTSPANGGRYIVDNGQGDWAGYDGYIAEYTMDGTTASWVFTQPGSDDMVYVTSDAKKYVYSEGEWVDPEYTIPLEISVDVFRESTYSGSLEALTEDIRDTIVEAFTDRFGINAEIYRSEIIDVVQGVDGVNHCRLLKPVSSIFFNFDINDFTQTELLQYAPEYVYFTTDNITIRVY